MKEDDLGGASIPDFARRWNVPESTVWLRIKQGKIRTVKLGPRATRIPREEEVRLSQEGL